MTPVIIPLRLPWVAKRRLQFRDYIASDGRMTNWKGFGSKRLYPAP
jgi:hypothetical protein